MFGEGGGGALAARFGVPLLAQIPLVAAVREGRATPGTPIVVAEPDASGQRASSATLADRVAAAVGRAARAGAGVAP